MSLPNCYFWRKVGRPMSIINWSLPTTTAKDAFLGTIWILTNSRLVSNFGTIFTACRGPVKRPPNFETSLDFVRIQDGSNLQKRHQNRDDIPFFKDGNYAILSNQAWNGDRSRVASNQLLSSFSFVDSFKSLHPKTLMDWDNAM